MTSFARHKVSKQKRRFKDKKNGFDLDLTYITKRIIAMGFPSDKTEALYRNPISEVQRFYELFHQDNYYLYNLCQERDYDHLKFHDRVSNFPFYDHNAPPLNLIAECCQHIDAWLAEDEERIVGINCKAGKGRTGLIICCYLLHSGQCTTSEEALVFYGNRRTKDGKGVTIASQQRYIRYYEKILQQMGGVIPEGIPIKMTRIRITHYPKTKLPEGVPFATIEINDEIVHVSGAGKVEKVQRGVYKADIPVQGMVHGDVKIQIQLKKKSGGKQKLCHFWFNSGFIDETLVLDHNKSEIDVANKDKKCKVFPEGFAIQAFFSDEGREDKPKKSTKTSTRTATKEKTKKTSSSKTKPEKTSSKRSKKPEPEPEPEPETPSDEEVIQPVEMNDEDISEEPVENVEEVQNAKGKKNNKRKSFYDYSDYGALQDQIELSGDSEGLSFSSSD